MGVFATLAKSEASNGFVFMAGTKHTKFISDIPGEIWRNVVGYEDSYMVSNLGRLRSYPKQRGRQFIKSCYLISPKVTRTGYLNVSLNHQGTTKHLILHRIVATAFIANPENKPQVNHIDGNKKNCVVENLEWTTALENIQHGWKTGLYVAKESLFKKLSWDEVRKLRSLYPSKTYFELSDMYGLSFGTIGRIIRNETYIEGKHQ